MQERTSQNNLLAWYVPHGMFLTVPCGYLEPLACLARKHLRELRYHKCQRLVMIHDVGPKHGLSWPQDQAPMRKEVGRSKRQTIHSASNPAVGCSKAHKLDQSLEIVGALIMFFLFRCAGDILAHIPRVDCLMSLPCLIFFFLNFLFCDVQSCSPPQLSLLLRPWWHLEW